MSYPRAFSAFVVVGMVALALVVSSCGETPALRVADPSVAQLPLAAGPVAHHFDTDVVDQAPAGFTVHTVGPGRPAQWLVKAASDAPSAGNVLMQCDNDDTNHRYPCVLSTAGCFGNVRVSVKAKGISGNRDRSFGVIVRAIDEKNYYVAR